jgi:beta-lactamase regulating signal transducer with metallopeptidase domain
MEHLVDSIVSFSAVATSSFASAVFAGFILLIAAVVLLRLLPEIRPANRFIVWASVLLVAISLYFIPLADQKAMSSLHSAKGNVVHLDPRWALGLVVVWAVIAVVRLLRILQSAIEIRGISRRSEPVPSGLFDAILQQGSERIALCTSDEIDRPCVVGFTNPKVLIPAAIYSDLSPVELEQIVVHEVGHLRRYDNWSNLLQKIGIALFPLNPAIAWIERRLCVERELACDDCVLHATLSRKQYATCLTNLAEFSILHRNLSLSLGAWGRRSELAYRVNRILNRPIYKIGPLAGYGLTAALVAGLFAGGAMLGRVPALVSFSVSPANTSSASVAPSGAEGTAVRSQVQGPQASAVQVKAVMPQPRQNRLLTQHRVSRTANSLKKDRRTQPGTLLMRTEFNEEFALPRLVLTVDKQTGSSYAAVPLGNGWLVIQL